MRPLPGHVPARAVAREEPGKQPFAIVGINSDGDLSALKKAVESEEITWRSFWDGGSKEGPIATRWNVPSWPTLYLLDGKGVIRYERPVGGDLTLVDRELEKLLRELEPAAKN